jgi:hypothetical protein
MVCESLDMNQQWQQSQWQPQQPRPKRGFPAWVVALLIGGPVFSLIAIGGFTCFFVAVGAKQNRAKATATATTATTAAPRQACYTGDDCYLRTIGRDKAVPVFGSEDALSAATKAAARKDALGFASQVAFDADDRTLVLVIDRGFEKAQVRVRSGKHIGRTGWVGTESLKP